MRVMNIDFAKTYKTPNLSYESKKDKLWGFVGLLLCGVFLAHLALRGLAGTEVYVDSVTGECVKVLSRGESRECPPDSSLPSGDRVFVSPK